MVIIILFTEYEALYHGYDWSVLMQVIKGIVDGCQQSDCTLLGGEVSVFYFPVFLGKMKG